MPRAMNAEFANRSTNQRLSVETFDWVPLPAGTAAGEGFVRADFRADFEGSGPRRLDDYFTVAGEALTKPGLGTRYRARLHLHKEGRGLVVYLKRFGKEPYRDRLRRRFEHGEWRTAGEQEMWTAGQLNAEGIPAPAPLAWGWRDDAARTRHSFVVLSAAPGEPASRWIKTPRGSAAEESARKHEFIRVVATLAREFHRRGWRHRDFYLCHLMVLEAAGSLKVTLIDLQRVFRPRWRPTRWQIKDLAQLNYSARSPYFSASMRMRFAHLYFGVDRLTSPQKRLIRQVLRKTRSIARHARG
jgi:heptose I phosphotransferase